MDNMFCPAVIYPNAKIVRQNGSTFFLPEAEPESTAFDRSWGRDELGYHIHQCLQLRENQKINKMYYRWLMGDSVSGLVALAKKIRTDRDVHQMFDAFDRGIVYLKYIEVMVEIVDIGGSGTLAPNDEYRAGPSSSRPPRCIAEQPHQIIYDGEGGNHQPYHGVEEEFLQHTPFENAIEEVLVGRYDEEIEEDDDDPDYNTEIDDDSGDDDSAGGVIVRTSLSQKRKDYSAVPFMRRLNLDKDNEHAGNSDVPVYDPEDANADIKIGMTFADKESLVLALKHYCLQNNVDYLVTQSESEKYAGVCKYKSTGCRWRVRARLGKKTQVWKITKYEGPHTCNIASMTVDHRKLDSDFICSAIMRTICENPGTTVAQIISDIDQRFQYQPTYKRAWIAKQKAITKIFGDWDDSYMQLPRLFLALKQSMPETAVEFEVQQAYYPNGTACDDVKLFGRVFWAFTPCIRGFPFCKPIVQLDGTHLYGRYKGTLLIAVTQDGNNNVFPIAFALVESENNGSWTFFIKNLRQHVCTQENLCIISDRHDSIKFALNEVGWVPNHAVHRYCIRHFAANFGREFKDVELRKAMTNAGYAADKKQFLHWYGIAAGEPTRKAYLDRVPIEKWTQFYDGYYRWGQMTTNLVECINNVLKGTRHLPITALVSSTYYRLLELFDRRGVDAETQAQADHRWSQYLIKIMQENQRLSRNIRISASSRRTQKFTSVQYIPQQQGGGIKQYTIDLEKQTCSCGMFQIHRYPCAHAYAAIASQHLDWGLYVHDVYRIENLSSAYSMDFGHIVSEEDWPEFCGTPIVANPQFKRTEKGRPKTSRIRSDMDIQEEAQSKRCGLCRQVGHFRGTCPHKDKYQK